MFFPKKFSNEDGLLRSCQWREVRAKSLAMKNKKDGLLRSSQ
jgi:hypothetical protein